jgi:NAD(P)-dependent dehydrogenase (short-subunit alcohol dehydrogenase family)
MSARAPAKRKGSTRAQSAPPRPTRRGRRARRSEPARAGAPLAGQVALVTGAGRGLGRALAEELAAAGASVVLAARTAREIRAGAATIERRGGTARAVVCDVRDARSVLQLVDTVVREFHHLDIVVNNAGVFQIAPLAATDEALWQTILDTNLTGAYRVARAALQPLVRSRGLVVNIVSVAGRVAFPGDAAYCASKFGLLGLTNVLREELRPLGVRVTAVLPGAIDTPVWDGVSGTWDRTTMLDPRTVARMVAHACSMPASAMVDEITLTPAGRAP